MNKLRYLLLILLFALPANATTINYEGTGGWAYANLYVSGLQDRIARWDLDGGYARATFDTETRELFVESRFVNAMGSTVDGYPSWVLEPIYIHAAFQVNAEFMDPAKEEASNTSVGTLFAPVNTPNDLNLGGPHSDYAIRNNYFSNLRLFLYSGSGGYQYPEPDTTLEVGAGWYLQQVKEVPEPASLALLLLGAPLLRRKIGEV